jgi:hypothetical protein
MVSSQKNNDCDAMWVKAGQESDEKMQPIPWTGPSPGPDKDLVRSHWPYPPFNRAGLFLPVVSPLFLIRWQFVLPIVSRMSQCAAIKGYLNRWNEGFPGLSTRRVSRSSLLSSPLVLSSRRVSPVSPRPCSCFLDLHTILLSAFYASLK